MLEVEQPTRNEQQTVTGSQARWNEDAPVLRVSGLRKRFHRRDGTEVIAINDVSFEVHAGELLVLLGPSGCGKTTLLRSVAGLEEPDAGTIEVQGRTVFSSDQRINIRAEQRKLSMVFQSYALWPHMTVQENIAYPLESLPRGQRPSKAEVLERVNEIMAVVGLHGLNKQYPNAISGGQQQRVALCRALIAGSSLVLFDEPLSNVDAQVREQLRDELLTMQRQLKFAALFVTHDRHEAMVLGNHIAVLNQGNLLQLDSPEEIYGRPADTFVARFIGPTNEVPVQAIAPGQNGLDLVAETPLGEIRGQRRQDTEAGAEQVAVWRPELCELSAEEPSVANRWQCTVEQALYFGPQLEYIVTAGGQTIRILTTGKKAFDSGAQAWVSVHPQNVSFLTHR